MRSTSCTHSRRDNKARPRLALDRARVVPSGPMAHPRMRSRHPNEGDPLMAGTALCLLAFLLLLLTTPAAAQAPLEISFWYGVGGQLEKVIQSQAEKFNKSQPGVKVVPFF